MATLALAPLPHVSKSDSLRKALVDLTKKLETGKALPTIRQLSESFRVSKASLHFILRELENQGKIVRKHGRGIFVAPKTVGLILAGDVFESGRSPVFKLMVDLIYQYAEAQNIQLRLYLDAFSQKNGALGRSSLEKDVKDSLLDGALLIAARRSYLLDFLKQKRIPRVMFSDLRSNDWTVNIDYGQLIRLAVRELANRGCQRIGLISSLGYQRARDPSFTEDVDAFCAALTGMGFQPNNKWIWEYRVPPAEDPMDTIETAEEIGMRAIHDLFDGFKKQRSKSEFSVQYPDGLVITDDMITRGSLMALQEMDLQPGQDIKIASHANQGTNVLKRFQEDVILLEVKPEEIIQTMFAMLQDLMQGHKPNRKTVLIKPTISDSRGVPTDITRDFWPQAAINSAPKPQSQKGSTHS